MRARQWRLLIWVGTLGLGAFAGLSAWGVWKNARAKVYDARPQSQFEGLISAAVGSIDQREVKSAPWERYAPLHKVAINGYEPEKPAPPPTTTNENVKLPEKPLADVITVTAITAAPDDAGRIVVKYKDDSVKPVSKDEIILKVGSTLAYPYEGEPYNSRLKAIRTDTAIFDWCGKEVEVHPMRKGEGQPPKPEAGAPAAKVDSSLTQAERDALKNAKDKERTTSYTNDGYVVGSKDISEMSHDPNRALMEAKVVDRKDANGKKQVVIGQIRPTNRMAQAYGVQTDDALVSINGTPVTSKAQLVEYVRANNNLEKYVVVILRKGKEITKTVLVNRD
jgi:hypothetical protein